MAHATGRGWKLTLATLLLLGTAGALFVALFCSDDSVYRADGLLRIQVDWREFASADETIGDHFVPPQSRLLATRPLIEAAMKRPEWKDTGLPTDQPTIDRIARGLRAEHPATTGLVHVYFIDKEKKVVAKVVKAIVRAYYEHALKRAMDEEKERLTVLEEDRANRTTRINGIEKELLRIAEKCGLSSLDTLLEAKLQEETKLEALLHDAELRFEREKREVLQARVDDIRKKYEEVRKGRTEIGEQVAGYQDLTRQRDDLIKERLALQQRIDAIKRDYLGRIEILDEGRQPTEPYRGK